MGGNTSSEFLTVQYLKPGCFAKGLLKFGLLHVKHFERANNKGADQTVPMNRLVCVFCCLHAPKSGFLATRSMETLRMLGC